MQKRRFNADFPSFACDAGLPNILDEPEENERAQVMVMGYQMSGELMCRVMCASWTRNSMLML